ncbi:hypothetical protein NLY44_26690 [Mesorhizobium sp. C089B]|uniref:hypothetical protein n=1 Tax=Mesorhizobium sp. C089B TaxID=2956823 RepID=UPI0025761C80|nr:hypothetical protein [Mesorhizobium sp. C089B]WJI54491.1 hypothetical protein NLY44_26690 [Mesorhizobium sp. C089B]
MRIAVDGMVCHPKTQLAGVDRQLQAETVFEYVAALFVGNPDPDGSLVRRVTSRSVASRAALIGVVAWTM